MSTFLLNKRCERCDSPLPDDFNNLLCYDDYYKMIQEQEEKKVADKEHMIAEVKKNPDSPLSHTDPVEPVFGIKDPNYQTNPEQEDKDQILANLAQFIYSHDPAKKRTGKLLWYPQRNMYTFIKNYCMKKAMSHPQYPKYIWKPKIVDVGCGSGVGANVMSQEADFVWGIDKNAWSIEFAKEAFERIKNGQYYSNQLTFDVFDILEDTRETMKFDIVVAIEVIEHIFDTDKFLKSVINKFTKKDKNGNVHIQNEPTEFFFSSPNRAFIKLRKDKPANIYHVREWTCAEFVEMLRKYFEEVKIYNQKGEPIAEDSDKDEVIFAHCWHPKI